MKKISEIFKKKKKVLIVGALVLVVVGGVVFNMTRRTAQASEAMVGGTSVAAVTKQDLTKSITVSGTINSKATYNVSSEIASVKIEAINVKVGDQVKAGDVLATLDDTRLEKSLASAQSAAGITGKQNSISVAEAERNYNSTVAANDTSVNRSNEALNSAKNAQNTANSNLTAANEAYNAAVANRDAKNQALANAQSTYDTAAAAYESAVGDDAKAAAQAVLETAAEALESAQAEATAAEAAVAEAKLKVTAAQEGVNTANSGVTTAQHAVDDANTARTKANADVADAVETSKLAAASSARTANDTVEQAKEQLSKATLVAPSDGVVTAVNAKVGDVYSGTTMIVIQDTSGYKVSASLDQYDISDVAMDMKSTITTDTTGKEEMKGSVTFVSPTPAAQASVTAVENNAAAATSTNITYPIEVTINNPSERLRIGMNAKVKIEMATAKNVLTVPASAVQQEEDGSYYVEVATDDNGDGFADTEEFTKLVVTQGLVTDYYVEVSGKGLSEGMFVVIPTEEVEGADNITVSLF
ncbi:MAG: HlyD family efflux transporter periplasmic adaptor subunit [Lachnospiraceae bacterium]|nr:HlyD family efflux transporter periplasmic adaptor subunit [Lachnospiraceae bacterium]